MRKSLVVLLGLLICSCASAATVIRPGETPPPYIGKTLSGKSVYLPSLHGDVVVISFWATWCHFCIRELPVWAGMQAVAARHGLHMQVVAVDYKQSRYTFARAVHLLKPRVPGLIITGDPEGRIGRLYGVSGIPLLVMLHSNGKVAYVHVGYQKSELNTLIKEVNILLNEQVMLQRQSSGATKS